MNVYLREYNIYIYIYIYTRIFLYACLFAYFLFMGVCTDACIYMCIFVLIYIKYNMSETGSVLTAGAIDLIRWEFLYCFFLQSVLCSKVSQSR